MADTDLKQHAKTLGLRLRYFRTRAGLSQFNLELEIDAAPGSLSRIESGQVNPTRETILKLAKVLALSERELDYINGASMYPATEEEIANARQEVKEYFSKKNTLAYLLDERYRLHDISEGFLRFLNWDREIDMPKMIGRSFIWFVLNPEFQILERLKEVEVIMHHLLERFYSELGFMVDDPYYQEALQVIEVNPMMSALWEEVLAKPPVNLHPLETRKVHFYVKGVSVPLYYSDEFLKKNNRFQLIEYTPTSKLLHFLAGV